MIKSWGVLVGLLAAATACGAWCGPEGCWPAPTPQVAMVRISHAGVSGRSLGSGTLVAHRGDRSYCVTCAHVFDSSGRTEVIAPDGSRVPGRVIAIDRQHDLAVVETQRVMATPVELGSEPRGELSACGFGPTGQRRCVRGALVGYATPAGATSPSLRMRGAVRPGDSGGPVLDASGRLVGVVWGARSGETYASFGAPLRRILDRVKLGGAAARPRGVERPVSEPATEPLATPEWRAAMEKQIEGIDKRMVEGFGALRRQLTELAPRSEVRAIGERTGESLNGLTEQMERLAGGLRAMGTAAARPWIGSWLAGLVTAGAPVGVGVALGWYAWRKRRKRAGGASSGSGGIGGVRPIAVDSPPVSEPTARETHYVPYETDDFAKAHQWASEQLARKFPGSVEWLASLDSLIKQQLAGRK